MQTNVVDGILNIYKPSGITSMDVVRNVKRITNQRKVGHAGTLDPFASGVVPICLGRATKMIEYLFDIPKEYHAIIHFGVETDTYDCSGEILREIDLNDNLKESDIRESINSFIGNIEQVPPMFSALKFNGKRLYDLARAGIQVDRSPRPVTVYSIEISDWGSPYLTLDVKCGRGFYMRSLAYDLGSMMHCGGSLKSLVRINGGGFSIENSITLEVLSEHSKDNLWLKFLNKTDSTIMHFPVIYLNPNEEEYLKNTGSITVFNNLNSDVYSIENTYRLYSGSESFLGVTSFSQKHKKWVLDRAFW